MSPLASRVGLNERFGSEERARNGSELGLVTGGEPTLNPKDGDDRRSALNVGFLVDCFRFTPESGPGAEGDNADSESGQEYSFNSLQNHWIIKATRYRRHVVSPPTTNSRLAGTRSMQ